MLNGVIMENANGKCLMLCSLSWELFVFYYMMS